MPVLINSEEVLSEDDISEDVWVDAVAVSKDIILVMGSGVPVDVASEVKIDDTENETIVDTESVVVASDGIPDVDDIVLSEELSGISVVNSEVDENMVDETGLGDVIIVVSNVRTVAVAGVLSTVDTTDVMKGRVVPVVGMTVTGSEVEDSVDDILVVDISVENNMVLVEDCGKIVCVETVEDSISVVVSVATEMPVLAVCVFDCVDTDNVGTAVDVSVEVERIVESVSEVGVLV